MHRLLLSLLLLTPALAQPPAWQTRDARAAGMDPQRLRQMQDELAKLRTDALLVVRRGRIVHEWYAPEWNAARPHGTASLAKALVGGMSLLVALNDGRLALDDPASKFIPSWQRQPLKSKITIRQLATHTSGLEDAEQDNIPHMQLPGWKGAFWKRQPDPFSISIRDTPVVFEPGQGNAYSNPGMAALGYAITASLRGTAYPDLKLALRDRILRPLAVPDTEWEIGYGQGYSVDGLSLYATWGGASFTARAAARVGLLMLQRGEFGGQRLFASTWVDRMQADAGMPVQDRASGDPAPRSGLGWWINTDGIWPGVPRDTIVGAGAGHQVLIVIPSLDLVVVRYGQALTPPGVSSGFWAPILKGILQPVMESVVTRTAYPPSPVIAGVQFAPKGTILRQAPDSDNWPLTWGDDGALYTAYGDGRGFAPFTEQKLSLGFARVDGTAAKFRGVNIRSATGERTGDGAKGAKASGLLMVRKRLYMWVRNVGNAQLAWSDDRGKTWTWGFRLEQSFGAPAFLNYGRNYAGARDGYVYVYSQDGASAYDSDNGVVLMRAPVRRLTERAAWEFFAGLDSAGAPRWSSSLDARQSVFRNPRRCQRVDAVYHPVLKRYLLVAGFNHTSGWGMHDAPEPWGPWTTAFETEHWDIEGAHGYRLPAKWFSGDGKSLSLVYSATHGRNTPDDDAFCVREVQLQLR
ncbi:serine hydrolase [Paludibaculum fermentans]|uniref:serine hydrolase n=1 Tax=Paludibaculum fermentans TaxID=1473598 RepID=UPI003EBFD90F